MKQSRLMSLAESAINIVVGVVIAMTLNAIVLPKFGFAITFEQNAIFAGIMTAVSIVRSYGMRRLFEALHIRNPISPFMAAVIAERRRQIESEGWSHDHDDSHVDGELALAGASYLFDAATRDGYAPHCRSQLYGRTNRPFFWPWSDKWWKPDETRRELVKGCALGIAEGEKFDRGKKRRRARSKGAAQ